uniref:MSP domain-containing protein n=1 Tax=Oryza rufipogon TaxID=4529 RepID=A0A0E0PC08_ORYRU
MGSDSKELLGIEPLELRFPFETKKQISCSMQLTNRTDDYIAFKVKTTSPKKYCVRPNSGIVPPRSTSDVIGYAQFSSPSCKTLGYFPRPVICVQKIDITMQAQREAPADMQCKDKFLVQSVVVTEGTTTKDVTGEMFNKGSGNVVDERKLKVVYVQPPRPPSPVREGSEEGSSPRASLLEGGNLNYQDATRAHKDAEDVTSDSETSALISRLTEERNSAIQQNNKLLEEMDLVRREISKQNGGFPFVFVVVVALLGILLGYIMKR